MFGSIWWFLVEQHKGLTLILLTWWLPQNRRDFPGCAWWKYIKVNELATAAPGWQRDWTNGKLSKISQRDKTEKNTLRNKDPEKLHLLLWIDQGTYTQKRPYKAVALNSDFPALSKEEVKAEEILNSPKNDSKTHAIWEDEMRVLWI